MESAQLPPALQEDLDQVCTELFAQWPEQELAQLGADLETAVRKVKKATGFRKVDLVGHSMGGPVIVEASGLAPAAVVVGAVAALALALAGACGGSLSINSPGSTSGRTG